MSPRRVARVLDVLLLAALVVSLIVAVNRDDVLATFGIGFLILAWQLELIRQQLREAQPKVQTVELEVVGTYGTNGGFHRDLPAGTDRFDPGAKS